MRRGGGGNPLLLRLFLLCMSDFNSDLLFDRREEGRGRIACGWPKGIKGEMGKGAIGVLEEMKENS